ncbi:hypothetical protein ACQP1G_40230 [Nocardia sp. CA-107356]|uniref:hypothetical protein n=1 Tax=Nocardia sp. CA-107356 TaxID=3239972 RepID=UPI003D8CA421
MTGWQVFAVGLVAVLAVMTAVIAIVWFWPSRVSQGRSVEEIWQRVEQEDDEMDTAIWPVGFPHDAPEHPLGVLEAQLTMQRHVRCRVDHCPRKTAAWRTLVAAGKIEPDAGRNY